MQSVERAPHPARRVFIDVRRNSASVCARGTTRLELLTFSAEGWESFAVVVGAASGALTGFLFVAVSVNAPGSRDVQGCAECGPDARPIRRTTARCDSARHTRTKLGGCSEAELIALGVVTGATMALVGRGKAREGRDETARLIRLLDRASPNLLTSLLIALAGIAQLAHTRGGLYWLVPGVVVALVGGVANTWRF